ncbi:hypothetical protein CcI49_06775 [Frankia sp. CcI49]|uniref:hypothetical protein n=1 Tax=Frankia sp. CcI49 TaxID=1745382 RepID=UPI000977C72F|nr:hypothetical protein [Frankia sp. CcI49]ONH61287.1 hypothetical protein CcI49_06775 [Frankia sp. CcI49]
MPSPAPAGPHPLPALAALDAVLGAELEGLAAELDTGPVVPPPRPGRVRRTLLDRLWRRRAVTVSETETRWIAPGDYRCLCGVALPVRRTDMTRLDCPGCGHSFTWETLGDPPAGTLTCVCGATSTGRGGCVTCGAPRRPMVAPHAGEPKPSIAATPKRARPIPLSGDYRCVCGAQVRVLAVVDRVTCDGCGRHLDVDTIGDSAWGPYACFGCGSVVDPTMGRPCPLCATPRRVAVDLASSPVPALAVPVQPATEPPPEAEQPVGAVSAPMGWWPGGDPDPEY